MKPPARLQSLIEEGLIDTVVRQLMSGKEAMVFVVRGGEHTHCAKVYEEASQRSLRQAVDYTENRQVKNARQARAIAKGTKFGRQAEAAGNNHAQRMRLRDVGNLADFFGQFAPELRGTAYGPEICGCIRR